MRTIVPTMLMVLMLAGPAMAQELIATESTPVGPELRLELREVQWEPDNPASSDDLFADIPQNADVTSRFVLAVYAGVNYSLITYDADAQTENQLNGAVIENENGNYRLSIHFTKRVPIERTAHARDQIRTSVEYVDASVFQTIIKPRLNHPTVVSGHVSGDKATAYIVVLRDVGDAMSAARQVEH